jgi:hypothetical protein
MPWILDAPLGRRSDAAGSLRPVPTADAPSQLVATVGFGGPGTGRGIAWCASQALALVGEELVELSVSGTDGDGVWTLAGRGVELRVQPVGEPAGEQGWSAQACRVCGEVARGGRPAELDAPGVRCRRTLGEPRAIDSLRHVCAWFSDGSAVALDAVRPRQAKGHDRDHVSAILLGPEGAAAVDEGRLSTTYRDGGRPARVGLELWLAGEEETYPRRLAGEAERQGRQASLGELELWLAPLLAHHAGQEGAGALILASPRR